MRVLVEILYIIAGLVLVMVIAELSAWSYPRASRDIWNVAYGAMIAAVLLGVRPVMRAYAEQQSGREASGG